jgi:hypothetical protein
MILHGRWLHTLYRPIHKTGLYGKKTLFMVGSHSSLNDEFSKIALLICIGITDT